MYSPKQVGNSPRRIRAKVTNQLWIGPKLSILNFKASNSVYNENFNSGSKFLKLARNTIRFTLVCLCIEWDFHDIFKASFSISVSGRWINFIFKTCQTVTGVNMADQVDFPDFFFWQVFNFKASNSACYENFNATVATSSERLKSIFIRQNTWFVL